MLAEIGCQDVDVDGPPGGPAEGRQPDRIQRQSEEGRRREHRARLPRPGGPAPVTCGPMTRLHFVRHAPTADTGIRLTGRLPGVGLDPGGREQAEELGRRLAGAGLRAVYSSPLRRCRETARAVATPVGLDVIPYRSLIEVDYGSWSGRTLKSLQRTKLWPQLFTAPSRVTFPGGESLGAVQSRAVRACEEVAGAHPSGAIALVSHGDVIKTVLAHYLGVPLDLFQRITIDPASVSVVELPASGPPRIVSLNGRGG